MSVEQKKEWVDHDLEETQEWIDSLAYVLQEKGQNEQNTFCRKIQDWAYQQGTTGLFASSLPYVNTIPVSQQSDYPGDIQLEKRILAYLRWNAMIMVARANQTLGLGGHIATFASSANIFEIGFNHFFNAKSESHPGDQVYYQAHACPGLYARAFLEGRLDEQHLDNFRQELQDTPGLSSYPHPWLMPDFWEFPSVSMGLTPIMSIYQARFNRYLESRGLKTLKIAMCGRSMEMVKLMNLKPGGAIRIAGREKLDNLTFIINCNLQRLDGPVFGNGKIIQELEGSFRGAGWHVIKVIWASAWDDLLAKDTKGLLVKRMTECIDGEYQKYQVESGAYIREHFLVLIQSYLNLLSICLMMISRL